jgi:hypothetical protein
LHGVARGWVGRVAGKGGAAVSGCECVGPSCFTQKTVRARKAHTCAECGTAIRPGDAYQRITGIWDGSPGRYARHPECVAFHDAFEKHVRDGQAAEREALRTAPIGVRVRHVYDYLCDCIALGEVNEALAEFCVEVHGYSPRDPVQPRAAGGGAL